jgi:hypothetical protein
LDVDLEQDVRAPLAKLADGLGGRAVPVSVDLGPLQQLARRDELVESLVGDEGVVDPVPLAGAGRTGRDRDGQGQAGPSTEEPSNDRALPDPGGAGDDEQPAGL